MTDNNQKLLEFIMDEDLERLENIINNFNIFSALGIVSLENIHSNFLSWLMNPSEIHGLSDYVLKRFLRTILVQAPSLVPDLSIFNLDGMSFSNAEVLREWNRIDITIIDDHNKIICIIENKINIKEHSNQLKRYKTIVNKEYPDYCHIYIYLTIEGDSPSDKEYIGISYDEISNIIDITLKHNKENLKNEIYTLINDYNINLRRYILEDSELQKLCQQIYVNHKSALELIYSNMRDQPTIIKNILRSIIEADDSLVLDKSTKHYIRFIPKKMDFIPKIGDGWTNTKRVLLFEIQNWDTGITLKMIIGPSVEKKIREKIYDLVKNKTKLFNESKKPFKKGKWFTIYKKKILKSSKYKDIYNEDELREIILEKEPLIKEDISDIVNFFVNAKEEFLKITV